MEWIRSPFCVALLSLRLIQAITFWAIGFVDVVPHFSPCMCPGLVIFQISLAARIH